MNYVLLLLLLLLLGGLLLLWLSRRMRQATGLPAGEVIFSDTGAWEQVEKPLISQRYGLIGKPDYLVQVGKHAVPVEVKSRKKPALLLEHHVLQLGAYCLLVEDQFGQAPPYGLLRYRDATVKVNFTEQIRSQVLVAAEAIRRSQQSPQVRRNHSEAARCTQCGYQHGCGDQRLTKPPALAH